MLDGKQIRSKLIGSENERAVSPVIGVILMVAITVILAAVIATMVLDMSDGVGEQPTTLDAEVSANSEYDSSDSNNQDIAYINHKTGDTIAKGDLLVNVRTEDGASILSVTPDKEVDVNGDSTNDVEVTTSGSFDAGSTITISEINAGTATLDGSDLANGETVQIQVIDQSSDSTVVDAEVTV